MKKKLQLLMSVVMVLAIMLTPIQANSGRINIQLKDLPGDWDEKAGVVFTLYQVGKMSDDGKAELDAKYDMSLPSDAQGLQKIAKKLTTKEGKELIEKKDVYKRQAKITVNSYEDCGFDAVITIPVMKGW